MKSNKKGFTIVELVIVIAVIAILAAVLIPTIAGLVKKANISADQQAVRQMNSALAELGKEFKTPDDVVDALDAKGYNSKKVLAPVTKGYSFVWVDGDYDTIVLVDEADKLVFTNNKKLTAEAYAALAEETKTNFTEISKKIVAEPATVEAFREVVATGVKNINLTDDMTTANIQAPAGTTMTINLGGNTLSTTAAGERHDYAIDVFGTVTLTNGTIDARGVQVRPGGKLIIGEGVTINAIDSNGGAAVWVYEGGELEINGGTFTAMNGVKNTSDNYKYNPGAICNEGGKVVINGGTFKSAETICYLVRNYGELVINGGIFEGTHGIIASLSDEAVTTINGGEFTLNAYNDGTFDGHMIYAPIGEVIINGGKLNNGGFYGDVTDNREG